MGKNYFTEEQVAELRKNTYVKNVSEKAITYTEDFKEEFWISWQAGEMPTTIFRSKGFDIKAIGKVRINEFSRRVKAQAYRSERFADARSKSSGRPRTKEMNSEEYVKYLEHQVKLQKQQIEALKKMKQVEREAYWKHLRAQKKSSKSSKN